MSIPNFKQPLEPIKKSGLSGNSLLPVSVPSTLPTTDTKVLRLKWKNLDEFVKWKLEEERRSSVKLVSGLTHNRAQGYALQTGTILYLCQHNTVVHGQNSCPCFLRVQLLLNTSGVTALYNNRHSHETGGTETNSTELTSLITVKDDKKGKKPVYDQQRRPIPSPSTKNGLDLENHDSCGQYSFDIVKSIANLELKKVVNGEIGHISDVDLLRDRDVPQHNWALYGRDCGNSSGANSAAVFNTFSKLSLGVNETLIEGVPVASTESDTVSVPAIQNSGAVNMSSPPPQPLGKHNTQGNIWPASWTSGPPLPAIDETSSGNTCDSSDRKRKSVDDGRANDNERTWGKKARNPWQYSSPGGDSSAFYGALPASSSQTADPWAFAQPGDTVATEWISPASNAASGGQAIEYATSSWPAGTYGWGEAPWEKAFTATYNDESYPRYTSQDVAQEHIPSVYGADDVGCTDLDPEYFSSWVGYCDDAEVDSHAGGVGSNIHAQINPAFDAQVALPFPDLDSEISPFAYLS